MSIIYVPDIAMSQKTWSESCMACMVGSKMHSNVIDIVCKLQQRSQITAMILVIKGQGQIYLESVFRHTVYNDSQYDLQVKGQSYIFINTCCFALNTNYSYSA